MNKLVSKDKIKRYKYYDLEKKKSVLRHIVQNSFFSNVIRWNAQEKLLELSKIGSISTIRNRCIVSGHRTSLLKDYKVSRYVFMRLSRNGNFYGVKKASW